MNQFEIDQLAQGIFESGLPPGWLRRKDQPDRHVDYRIELGDGGRPEGLIFAVQLKGTVSAKISKRGWVSFSELETEHLSYYVDRSRQPVFLVVVDVSMKLGWWIFLQRYAADRLASGVWRKQKTVTIRLPMQNRLDDHTSLLAQVRAAEAYMRDVWPGRPTASIRFAQDELETLDPRFRVRSVATEKRTQHVLSAKGPDPVPFTIRFKGKPGEIDRKVADLIERGRAVRFDSSEVEAPDSPLVAAVLQHGVEMQGVRELLVDLELRLFDGENRELGRLAGMPFRFRGGTREMSGEAVLPNSPWALRGRSEFDDQGGLHLELDFHFDTNKWEGAPLRRLPYFEQLRELILAAPRAVRGALTFWIGGVKVLEQPFGSELPDLLSEVVGHVAILGRAREVAEHLGVDPIVHLDVIEAEQAWIYALHEILIHRRTFRARGEAVTFRLQVPRPPRLPSLDQPQPIASKCPVDVMPFLGKPIQLKDVESGFDVARIINAADAKAAFARGERAIELIVTGAPGSTFTITASGLHERRLEHPDQER